jgi:hypothetical protein
MPILEPHCKQQPFELVQIAFFHPSISLCAYLHLSISLYICRYLSMSIPIITLTDGTGIVARASRFAIIIVLRAEQSTIVTFISFNVSGNGNIDISNIRYIRYIRYINIKDDDAKVDTAVGRFALGFSLIAERAALDCSSP